MVSSHRGINGSGYVDVYKYDYTNDKFIFYGIITDQMNINNDGDNFGYSISMDENNVVITSRFDTINGETQQGSASYFRLSEYKRSTQIKF